MIANKVKIEKIMADLGLSNIELAKKSKINVATIYALQRGRPLQIRTLKKLAATLGCQPSELLMEE